jgi:hypothetical protein
MKHLFPTPHELPPEHDRFEMMYPRCSRLGIPVVDHGPGFDCLDLQSVLGDSRYQALMKSVKTLFCCGHRTYPQHHSDPHFCTQDGGNLNIGGTEVHCVYATDLEVFLQSEGH